MSLQIHLFRKAASLALLASFTLAIILCAGKLYAAEGRAPDFTLKAVNGKDLSLSSFKGKVVVLVFWATWCPSCKDEMPKLRRLYGEMKDRGVEVLAVSSDYSMDSLKEYLAKNSFDFNIAYDVKREVTRKYKISFLPVSFLIDRNGNIAEKIPGELDWPSPEFRKKIEDLLRK